MVELPDPTRKIGKKHLQITQVVKSKGSFLGCPSFQRHGPVQDGIGHLCNFNPWDSIAMKTTGVYVTTMVYLSIVIEIGSTNPSLGARNPRVHLTAIHLRPGFSSKSGLSNPLGLSCGGNSGTRALGPTLPQDPLNQAGVREGTHTKCQRRDLAPPKHVGSV